MFTKKIVLYLVRKKLGLEKYQYFRFKNQKSNAMYVFADNEILKIWRGMTESSGVSLNWLLDENCEIEKIDLCDVKKECQ